MTPFGGIRLLDYQLPLKARRDDHGVGKVDLLGITEGARLSLLELKVGGQSPDTPLRAVVEGLAYCAMVQANLPNLSGEIHQTFGLTPTEDPLILLVIAPEDYWDGCRDNPVTEGWESMMLALSERIKQATHVEVEFLELVGFEFEMGHEETRPIITKTGICRRAI